MQSEFVKFAGGTASFTWKGMKCCCCPRGEQIWLELARPPSADQRELLDYVFQAWYALGRLGGFNSLNLQARKLSTCSATTQSASFFSLCRSACLAALAASLDVLQPAGVLAPARALYDMLLGGRHGVLSTFSSVCRLL